MIDRAIVSSIALLFWGSAAGAQAPNVQQIADTMVRLCLGGGSTQATLGSVTGGADVSLRGLDARGNLAGEYKINESNAEGLVKGIDNELTQVAADQADKVRDCLRPVRERLLDVLLPLKPETTPDEAKARIRDLEARLANVEPRHLSAEQAKIIREKTKDIHSNLGITSDVNCFDCAQYAADFQSALDGWTIILQRILGPTAASPKGLVILTPDPNHPLPEATLLVAALTAAHIPFDLKSGSTPRPGPPGAPVAAILISPKASF
jgi:hypothetical protein